MEQNLSLYHIFYVTAKNGNISKAASELFISQPAISKSIRKLEENLHCELFTRSSRGVSLTEEGRILFEHVSNAFSNLQTGEEKLREMKNLGMGHIRIGVSTTLCRYTLIPYLEDFIKNHPHVRISIECQSSNKTIHLLEEHKIDIGLIGLPKNMPQIHFDSIGEIEDVFVATPAYLQNLQLRSDEDATLMLLDKENLTRQYIDDYLLLNHIPTSNILEITTMDLLIDFAKIGLGIACVIKQFVQTEIQNNELTEIPLKFPIQKREIGFAYLKSAPKNHAMQEFLTFCTEKKHD